MNLNFPACCWLHQALKQKRDEVAARERAAAAERQALDLKIAALDNQQVCETAIHETPTETAGGAVAEQEALEDFGGTRPFSRRTSYLLLNSTFLFCGEKLYSVTFPFASCRDSSCCAIVTFPAIRPCVYFSSLVTWHPFFATARRAFVRR